MGAFAGGASARAGCFSAVLSASHKAPTLTARQIPAIT
jgi:hypothetical protein